MRLIIPALFCLSACGASPTHFTIKNCSNDWSAAIRRASIEWNVALQETRLIEVTDSFVIVECATKREYVEQVRNTACKPTTTACSWTDFKIVINTETWNAKNMWLKQVALHEFGHLMGAPHSEEPRTVMYKEVDRHKPEVNLTPIDIKLIKQP